MTRLGLIAATLAALQNGGTPKSQEQAYTAASSMHVLPDWFIRPWTDYYGLSEPHPDRPNGVYVLYREAYSEEAASELIIGDFIYS